MKPIQSIFTIVPREGTGVWHYTGIIVLCFLCYAYSSTNEHRVEDAFKETNAKLVLKTEGVEYAYPHFSKDNSTILFQSNQSGHWRICTVDTAGNNLIELTTDRSNNYFPDWSPDNETICFVSDRTGNEEIYLMDADGNNQRRLTDNQARDIHPYFSPDGEKIVFSSTLNSGGDLEIYQMNPDGTGLTRITDSDDNESCARMSPDNKSLIYLKNNNEGLDDVFLYSLADSSEINLTKTPTRDGWPTWSQDGKRIIFSAVEDGVYKLFAYHLDSESLTRLSDPSPPEHDCRANVSPDGKMIVFNRQYDNAQGRTNALYILNL